MEPTFGPSWMPWQRTQLNGPGFASWARKGRKQRTWRTAVTHNGPQDCTACVASCRSRVLMAVVLHQQAELFFATIVGKVSVHLPPGFTTEGACMVRANRPVFCSRRPLQGMRNAIPHEATACASPESQQADMSYHFGPAPSTSHGKRACGTAGRRPCGQEGPAS